MDGEKFGDFLLRRYHEEELAHPGRFGSLVKFGQWLGVKQATFSTWTTGSKTPVDQKTADALAEKLGVEVYDVLGMARRMPKDKKLNFIATVWARLPEQKQDEWYEIAKNLTENNAEGRDGKRRTTD